MVKIIRQEGNVLFNDTLNTFYLWLYGVGQIAIGYCLWLPGWVLLYAQSHRQDNTCHSLWYTSCGALAGTRNSSVGPPWGINPMTHRTMSGHSTTATSCSQNNKEMYAVLWSRYLGWRDI